MTSRLTLICHGATAATRISAFPAGEPLEERAFTTASALRLDGRIDVAWISPMRSARQTAEALSIQGEDDSGLRELDYGDWAGRKITEIEQEQPERLARWISDPHFVDHGGESIAMLLERVGSWMAKQVPARGRTVAVTHAAVIRAAVVHVLGAPVDAFWRIDVAPLSLAELRHDGRRWALRSCGSPLSCQSRPA